MIADIIGSLHSILSLTHLSLIHLSLTHLSLTHPSLTRPSLFFTASCLNFPQFSSLNSVTCLSPTLVSPNMNVGRSYIVTVLPPRSPEFSFLHGFQLN